MNSKEAKRYRKKAKALTVDWIKSLIPDEEGAKVNIDNFQDYMPEQKYVYANRRFMLSAFSERWFYKNLKNKRIKEIRRCDHSFCKSQTIKKS